VVVDESQEDCDKFVGAVLSDHVVRGDAVVAPRRRLPGVVGSRVEGRRAGRVSAVGGRSDVRPGERIVLDRTWHGDGLEEASGRVINPPGISEGCFSRIVVGALHRRDKPRLTERDRSGLVTSGEHADGVAVSRHERVEVHEVRDTLGEVRERGCHHGTAVGEADQDEIVEVFVEDVVDDVGDVGCQPDPRTGQVHTLTDTGQARRVRLMPRRPQLPPHEMKHVGAAPGPMNQHEYRHAGDTTSPPNPVPSRRLPSIRSALPAFGAFAHERLS
jgi:hypothetical protein